MENKKAYEKDNPLDLIRDIRKEVFGILKENKVKINRSYSLQVSLNILEDILKEDYS